ncbi:MAG: hypothetical protein JXA77_15725 [Bacteroidales bacterium]|nr:hypothetical protein [Bacteroidales bacterium]
MIKAEIKGDIIAYVSKNGNGKYGWYVGIVADPKDRLFNEHNVSEKYGLWIYSPADNSQVARDTEIDLIEELNAKGASGGGSDDTTFVYAYKITSTSKE